MCVCVWGYVCVCVCARSREVCVLFSQSVDSSVAEGIHDM